MRKAGNVVTMFYLIDYKKPQAFRVGMSYLSAKTQAEYECKKHEWRELSYAWFSGNMGGGKIIVTDAELSDPKAAKWHPVPPDSGSEVLWRFACVMEPSVVDFGKKR